MFTFQLSLYFIVLTVIRAENPCAQKEVEYGYVCVCNSTYCDTVPDILELSSGEYQLYTTDKDNLGFRSSTGRFSNEASSDASGKVTIPNLSDVRQTIIGFGGAFTDATGINIANLPAGAQEKLLASYFASDGIQYSIGRVPIGGTDFSTRGYTYCDEEDETLGKFALQDEDFNYKIPFIQKAKELRGDNVLRLFASAWSSPLWTKTTDSYSGRGFLKSQYYDLWAQYYLKFFNSYEQQNITFWGVTTQNEPINGVLGTYIPNIGFNSDDMVLWIKSYLGPAIRNSAYRDLKIILHDDNRFMLPTLHYSILSDDDVLKYADGIGLHWYSNFIVPVQLMEFAKSDKKDLFILSTEACNGYVRLPFLLHAVELGSWDRAVYYIDDIIDLLSYNSGGWVDWNMALNQSGGPTYIDNEVDSPIIVNEIDGEFYKQPMFYALGHFSKFVVPDSVRVISQVSGSNLRALAFKRPDGKLVVILSNSSNNDKNVQITIENVKHTIDISAHSINSLLYTI